MRGIVWLKVGLIVAAGLLVDSPAWFGEFLWDDPQYVTGNDLLRTPGGLARAWFLPGSAMEYYPLQQTVLWLQWRLFGAEPFGYHLVNALLHVASSLLLWRFFSRFGLRLGWLGGLLFAIHPANVESVAWISELKNTLSLPPFLVAMTAFVRFCDLRRERDYVIALVAFTLAMLTKISMAPFPFVILLYLWWRRGRVTSRDLALAAPFLAIALILSGLTVFAYLRFGALHPDHPLLPPIGGPITRLALAATTITFYFTHIFMPWPLLPIYPRWDIARPPWGAFLEMIVWLAVLLACWINRASFGRHVLLGLGFFLLMIAPFCGLAQQSYMYFTWVMDHFLYIAMIGPIGLVIASIDRLARRAPALARGVLGLALGTLAVAFAALCIAYSAYWRSSAYLWTYEVTRAPTAWMGHYNLGNVHRRAGRFDAAEAQYRAAIALYPAYDWSHNNLGVCLAETPQGLHEAMKEYRAAILLRARFAEAHNNLANALSESGHGDEAVYEYDAALAIQPGLIAARYNLALALMKLGRPAEAVDQLREILREQPDFDRARILLEMTQ